MCSTQGERARLECKSRHSLSYVSCGPRRPPTKSGFIPVFRLVDRPRTCVNEGHPSRTIKLKISKYRLSYIVYEASRPPKGLSSPLVRLLSSTLETGCCRLLHGLEPPQHEKRVILSRRLTSSSYNLFVVVFQIACFLTDTPATFLIDPIVVVASFRRAVHAALIERTSAQTPAAAALQLLGRVRYFIFDLRNGCV